MPSRLKCAIILVFPLLMLTGVGSRSALSQEARPTFREVLVGETYTRRLRQALETLPTVDELEGSSMPLSGQIVIRIHPGHQAEGLGIEVGDVIVSIDDTLCWAGWIEWPRRNRPQSMRLVTRDHEERIVEIQPGLVGVRHVPYRRPELAYIRRADRNKELDEEVLAGVLMCRRDPDLAETAWRHALEKGYKPDDLSDACGAMIALYQSRPSVAARFAERVPAIDAEHPYRLDPRDVARIAVASGRLDLLLGMDPLLQNHLKLDTDSLRTLWTAVEANGLPAESPIAAARRMQRSDLTKSAVLIDDPSLSPENRDNRLLQGKPITLNPPQGNPDGYYVGFRKPTRSFEVIARFSMTAEPMQTYYANVFEVLMVDHDYRRRHEIGQGEVLPLVLRERITGLGVGIARGPDGESQVQLKFGNQPSDLWYVEPTYDLGQPVEFEVHIVHVGAFAEAQINGITVATTPITEPTEYHGLYLMAVGAHVEFHGYEAYALE